MNILFLNSIGRNKFGGGEKWMVNAAKSLLDKGHCVTLASRKSSRILNYSREKGVPTTVIEIHSDFSPLQTMKIARYLREKRIDVLICNLNKDIRVAGLAARIAGNTVVIARHGMLLCSKKWKHKVSLTKLCDGIITNSNTIKKAYAAYGWFPQGFVKVIYNGIVIPEQVEPVDFTSRFPGKKIIYSAGRLSEQKGFTYLIDAAAILCKTRNDLVFVISGEGKLEHELKNRVQSLGLEQSFIFEGFAADIYPYLKGSDLFVLASLFEGMPNVVMEAMAVEKPVVATDVNGARELMLDDVTGLIVPPSNPEALARAIGSIIDNPMRLASFGQAGRERVAEHFTIQKMAELLEMHLFEKIGEKQAER
ncbi:MAG: glycosyltransferase [Chlorobium limicola]|uniref:Glycosyl transferase group 1 n=1 Tax=Chlorobium limicola (strain DSM 245 / NBRC 103803 / 6330) TaxID=290315 RepID=B3EF93_CHLL2|nr:glycosyltransferase [Chlorobium limicola]ACD89376.1 glycosyl transferase group 1 [Chlorobium limicola DSM 245]NTV20217.1 glycosyltransferase [Chlorobium limicola]